MGNSTIEQINKDILMLEELKKRKQEQENKPKDLEVPKFEIKEPQIIYKIDNKKKFLQYISVFLIYLTVAIIYAYMITNHVSIIWLILVSFATFPLLIMTTIFMVTRLWLDKTKIKEFIIKKLSKNFIVCNFYCEHHRMKKEIHLLAKGGTSINRGKEEIYIVDIDCIWFDNDNYPNINYVEGLPNPLKFVFDKDIKTYVDTIKAKNQTLTIEKDKAGNIINIIDVAYGSVGLQKFKNDKIFQELHTNPKTLDMIMKLVMAIVGIVLIMSIVIIIVVMVRK